MHLLFQLLFIHYLHGYYLLPQMTGFNPLLASPRQLLGLHKHFLLQTQYHLILPLPLIQQCLLLCHHLVHILHPHVLNILAFLFPSLHLPFQNLVLPSHLGQLALGNFQLVSVREDLCLQSLYLQVHLGSEVPLPLLVLLENLLQIPFCPLLLGLGPSVLHPHCPPVRHTQPLWYLILLCTPTPRISNTFVRQNPF